MVSKYKDDINAFNNFKKELVDERLSQTEAKNIARSFFGK